MLKAEPMCRLCLASGRPVPAKEVDHIVPKVLGGGDEDSNLQPLCEDCHKAKTAKEAGARR